VTETPLQIRIGNLCELVNGLSIEVEAWRVHTSSTGDFLLREVEQLIIVVNELKAKIQ
jgi:hypothetical protein